MNSLYFDYCASTPLHPRAYRTLMDSAKHNYANPSSMHEMGFEASLRVEESREQIARHLQVKATEVIFTSGATESNNLAIVGVARAWKKRTGRNPHIILSQIEHSSVYQCGKQLAEEGVEVSFLPVNSNGIVSPVSVKESLQANTILVSVMHVNNETGAVQPIAEIAELLKSEPQIHFHVDGVQGFGKLQVELEHIDLYTVSGHKIGGPKGIGLLVAKEYIEIGPLMYGGEQEQGVRPGTTNVPAVLSFTEAIVASLEERQEKFEYLTTLHGLVCSRLATIPGLVMNSPLPPLSSPHIINFSYRGRGVTSAMMISMLAKQGIIVSSQSACSSKAKLSRVLMAMTQDETISSSSIRLSLHEMVTQEDAVYLVAAIERMVSQLKSKNKFDLLQKHHVNS
ncbi:cysteine desulfurase family protein [Paenibacillus vini]|uniref:Aminotransferase V n=1 Tax=Paenibacillus vini TaxID=1476024 RepID=A0ABQ4M6A7_9BACL|nr:cysteine desulfurase family protein [Paenibacillus vini]GIP51546.1 aminotransferase V [Paenibacillus vini]